MTYLKTLAVVVTAAAAVILPTHAATVAYSIAHFAKDGSNTSILDNSGTLLGAINFAVTRTGPFSATNPDTTATINGVAFTSSNPGSAAATGGFGASGVTYSINSAGVDNTRTSAVSYTSAPGLYGLVYDVIRTSANGVAMTVTLSGLTIGQTYEFQGIFSADNLSGNVNDRLLFLPGNTPPATHPDNGTTNGAADLAYGPTSGPGLLRGTFTADSATQVFTFTNINQGNERVSLAGITLAAVPEAGSSLLVLSGALAGLVRRRRH